MFSIHFLRWLSSPRITGEFPMLALSTTLSGEARWSPPWKVLVSNETVHLKRVLFLKATVYLTNFILCNCRLDKFYSLRRLFTKEEFARRGSFMLQHFSGRGGPWRVLHMSLTSFQHSHRLSQWRQTPLQRWRCLRDWTALISFLHCSAGCKEIQIFKENYLFLSRSASPRLSVHLHRDPALDSHAYRRGPWKLIVGHHLVPFIFTKVFFCIWKFNREENYLHQGVQRDCRCESWLRRGQLAWCLLASVERLLRLGHRGGECPLCQVR